MSDENNDIQDNEKKPRFNEEQYKRLLDCSKRGKDGIDEWNKWHKETPAEEILLEGANLEGTHLEGANLIDTYLEGAYLLGAHLKGAYLNGVHLEGAKLNSANLEGAYLWQAHLEGADLRDANLEGADLIQAHLEGAKLKQAHLENANLEEACLEGADFLEANLKGTSFKYADLKRTNFRRAVVDGSTVVWQCKVSRHTTEEECGTDFSGVGINQIRINPETKQLLEYNIRRMNWLVWYPKHPILRGPVWSFWSLSDYGLSTGRIIGWFFGLALAFAVVYSNLAWIYPPGIVDGLFSEPNTSDRISLVSYFLVVLLRPIYFSVVTMTTLGFGDMYARAWSWPGHLLLMAQVLLGYVLLAALVTRFAVLFTAGGPAGRFSKHPKTPTKKPTKKPPK